MTNQSNENLDSEHKSHGQLFTSSLNLNKRSNSYQLCHFVIKLRNLTHHERDNEQKKVELNQMKFTVEYLLYSNLIVERSNCYHDKRKFERDRSCTEEKMRNE